MLKNSIVYDTNIVNICFKMKTKKDNGEMCAQRPKNFRSRGGVPKSRWVWTKNFGDVGDRSPPILGNPESNLNPNPTQPQPSVALQTQLVYYYFSSNMHTD